MDAQHHRTRLNTRRLLGIAALLAAMVLAQASVYASDTAPAGMEDLFQDAPADATPTPAGDPSEAAPGTDASLEELFGSDDADIDAPAKRPFTGFFQSELAYSTVSPEHWSKFRNLLEIGSSGDLDNGMRWKLSGRLSYDAAFDLEEDFYPKAVRDDRRREARLHETYLDIPGGDWAFRLGRQHIIWGEMVGLFFADVVSARDMRQFVAQEFELLRIPQWALRAEHFGEDLHLDAIWVPYMSYDEIGEPGDDFYRLPVPLEPGYGAAILGEETPSNNLSNSAFGLRLSRMVKGWDLSGFYYRSMDVAPAFSRSVEGQTLVFQPEHFRIQQLGGTLSKDIGRSLILKAEAVYTLDKRVSVTDLNDTDGLVKQDMLDYVVGLEHTFDSGARINVQLFQRWFPDHVASMIPDELESGYSVYATTEWLNGRLRPELTWIQGFNNGDWMARPKLNWHFAPNWRAALGADLFDGRPTTLLGQFDDADRVYAELRYSY
jgi:hypothetical protein